LIADPRLTATPHGESTVWRRVTQRSSPPNEPYDSGRFEAKYRLRPSFDALDAKSANSVFTSGPRLTGADQSPNLGAAAPSIPKGARAAAKLIATRRLIT
jgi:hypothetical protein